MVEVCLELDFIFNYTKFYLYRKRMELSSIEINFRKLYSECYMDGRTLIQLPPICDITDSSEQIIIISRIIDKITTYCGEYKLKSKSKIRISLGTQTKAIKMSRQNSLSRLVAINAVVCGLEIAACVAFTFIPPLLLKVQIVDIQPTRDQHIQFFAQVGFTETYMSIILGVAPFLALFTVPMLGKMSDSCTSRYIM